MMRILGMATGPAVNLLLSKIDTTWTLWGVGSIQVDPLNSVGLLLATGNVLVLIIVYLGLEEPPPKKKLPDIVGVPGGTDAASEVDKSDFWGSIGCIEVLLPIFILAEIILAQGKSTHTQFLV